jgi:hypothetical protein
LDAEEVGKLVDGGPKSGQVIVQHKSALLGQKALHGSEREKHLAILVIGFINKRERCRQILFFKVV